MTHTEDQAEKVEEEVRAKKARVTLAGAAIALLLAIILIMGVNMILDRQQYAQRAQEQTLTLAQEVQTACKEGSIEVGGRDICATARQAQQQVEADVVAGPPGPRGIQGEPGPTGPRGQTGPAGSDGTDGSDGDEGKDGAAGPAGEEGTDGAPGAPGETGEPGPTGPPGPAGNDGKDGTNGKDGAQGPAGPAGKDSTVPGPAGPTGPAGVAGSPGADGVGIKSIQCTGTGAASMWHITLTNGNTEIVNGPCKATITSEP